MVGVACLPQSGRRRPRGVRCHGRREASGTASNDSAVLLSRSWMSGSDRDGDRLLRLNRRPAGSHVPPPVPGLLSPGPRSVRAPGPRPGCDRCRQPGAVPAAIGLAGDPPRASATADTRRVSPMVPRLFGVAVFHRRPLFLPLLRSGHSCARAAGHGSLGLACGPAGRGQRAVSFGGRAHTSRSTSWCSQ